MPSETTRRLAIGWRGFLIGLAVLFGPYGRASADVLLESTHLIGVSLGSDLSSIPNSVRPKGYELSGGAEVSFDAWYRDRIPNLQIDFITEITPDFGFLWGVGTGEYGEKYQIDPSLRLGFLYTRPVGGNGVLSMRLTTRVGGRLRERTCTADYGDIGGVQRVNCRLAATPLEPSETLQYLWNEKPGDRVQASVNLLFRF